MGCGSSGFRPFHDAFELQEVIGKGRFGDVYSAVERASREPYALRIITRTGSSLKDLMQEAKLWRSVMDSKYIVQWYTIRAEGNSLFFLMEKCQCNFVRKLQLSTTWNLQKSRTAFKQMLRAVEWIHSAGVVHRNIKASNFMCGGDKGNTIMKLTDFSNACSAPQGGKLYQEVGSWQYRSAEMHGKVGYTEKTDLWSFGVMAYALLFNEFPFAPGVRDKDAIKAAILGHAEPRYCQVPGGQKVGEFLGPAARFCRVLLRRNPDIRCSAPEALQLGFITGMACSVEMESDCSVIKKQDQPSVRELAPAVDWDPGSIVDSQFSDFTVCMTRKQLESLPLLGAGDLNGKHSAQLGGTLTSVTFDLELLIGEASKCGIRRCRLALLRNTHMLTEDWFDVSSKVPLRFYFSSSYFDKSSAYTVAVRWLRPAESVNRHFYIGNT
ncbi:CRK8 [Symbiodinium sp. CCMP2592]|nr:CRK8 [Symbiodinium sp. CCMP2592]